MIIIEMMLEVVDVDKVADEVADICFFDELPYCQ